MDLEKERETKTSCWLFFKDFIYFLERGCRRGRGRETSISCKPPAGDLPHNPACALTKTRTSYLPVHRPALNPLSHTRQRCCFTYLSIVGWFLYMPWSRIESSTLVCWDDVLTSRVTGLGPVWFHLYRNSRKGKTVGQKNQWLPRARAWERDGL